MANIPVHPELTGMLAVQIAEDGAYVEKGDRIGEVECMKAFFPLDAPASGYITWHIELGGVVGPEDVVAEIKLEG
jgi:biotin carboxyl carrier protein